MPAATLENIQNQFMQALLNPTKANLKTIEGYISPGAHIHSAASLAIYQRSYILRLQQCLAEQFPATRYALGDELFNDFMKQYITECPSDSYTLFDLGKRFAIWLENNRPDKNLDHDQRVSWVDFMVELASYEYELFRLFDAPGQDQCRWPTSECSDNQLTLQPCLSLQSFTYPVAWYFHQVRAERAPQFPQAAPCNLVILRHHDQTTTYPVSPLHFRFLQKLSKVHDIQLALQDIAQWAQQPLPQVIRSWQSEVRQTWIEAGFFVVK